MRQLVKQLLFYFLSLISISLPQTLSSYNYDKISQVSLTFTNPTNNYISSGRARNGFSCSIRPSRQTPTYSDWLNAPVECSNTSPDLSNASVEWFQEYFHGINPAKILKEYKRYQLPGFRAFNKKYNKYN